MKINMNVTMNMEEYEELKNSRNEDLVAKIKELESIIRSLKFRNDVLMLESCMTIIKREDN